MTHPNHMNAGDTVIVAGFDRSTGASRALWWAAREANARTLPLVVVHAVNPPVVTAAYGWYPATDVDDPAIIAAAESAVEAVVSDILHTFPELAVSAQYPRGAPAQAVEQVAADTHAELTVIGSSGHGALPRVVLGSTAADLVRISDRPVIVVRGGGNTDDNHGRDVLLGLDGSSDDGQTLGFAFDYAARHHVGVSAVHGLPGHWADPMIPRVQSPPVSAATPKDAATALLGEALDAWRSRFPGVRASLDVIETSPAQALLEDTSQSGLVVVGSHRHGVLRRTILGSVSHAMLYHADCPVAVVPVSDAP